MKNSFPDRIKRFDGADRLLNVVRTAPMYSEKKKNFAELIPRSLLPQVSIMWAFLESYLKKTADVFRVYPETSTILEQRVADLKDSFKLQSEGKTVDAEMAGTHHILVNYLVRYSLVGNELTQDQREELFFNLQKVRAQLSNAYGTTPAVIAVDKIDRYVVDLMFMLAESVTKAVSDMSDKSWLECNMVLVAVLNVYRNRLNKLLEGFHVFINSAELGGATTPSFHAHAMSRRKNEGISLLPIENREDTTILTKGHFERLGPRTLDGRYLVETIQETALENFLLLSEEIGKKADLSTDHGLSDNSIHEEGRFKAFSHEDQMELKGFMESLFNISAMITGSAPYEFYEFLKAVKDNNIIELIEKYRSVFDDTSKPKQLSPARRAGEFISLMSNIGVKLRYWRRFSNNVFISPVSEIFAASLMKKIKTQGVEEKLRAVIRELVPEGMNIDFSVTDHFYFSDEDHTVPAFTFIAEPKVWSLYGKPVAAIAEESLNSHWEKIYYITEAYLRSIGDENAEEEILQKLDELIGVSVILQEMARSDALFELSPNSLLYASAVSGRENIAKTTLNYLKYFARCFAFARKKKILLLPGLCPRTTVIEPEEKDGVLKQIVRISPINVYTPVMELHEFERRFGPFSLLKEANARFELIGEGDDRFVIQKTGGECRTKGRPVFHRDKREKLMSRPRIDEEPLVEAISETIKQYVFTKENLGDIDPLYFHFYMKEYIDREYGKDSDFTWKKVAEILLFCPMEIYNIHKEVNIDMALQEGFAKSRHSGMEIGKAYRLIKIIKEAREEAIKKMTLVEQRSSKLKRQIMEGDFMATYELVMNTIRRCKEDNRFLPLVNSIGLPRNEHIQEHILYILGIRQVERSEILKGPFSKVARNDLLRDNLNTISFSKLAELIVEEAFRNVKSKRAEESLSIDEQRDLKNSEYLLEELISRIIYKYISESPKRRHEYYSAVKYYYEDHPFFIELQRHIAEELRRKSFQTEEHWKALGSSPVEGHVGLIEKCIVPTTKIGQCVINCEVYGDAMDEVITIIESNLVSQGEPAELTSGANRCSL